jgi:hypothetical protein
VLKVVLNATTLTLTILSTWCLYITQHWYKTESGLSLIYCWVNDKFKVDINKSTVFLFDHCIVYSSSICAFWLLFLASSNFSPFYSCREIQLYNCFSFIGLTLQNKKNTQAIKVGETVFIVTWPSWNKHIF